MREVTESDVRKAIANTSDIAFKERDYCVALAEAANRIFELESEMAVAKQRGEFGLQK